MICYRRVLRTYNASISKETSQTIAKLETRRNGLQRRLNSWFNIQASYVQAVLQVRKASTAAANSSQDALADEEVTEEHPEEMILFLPSQVPESLRVTGCLAGVAEIENRLRIAQASDALEHLKGQLCTYQGLVKYKITQVSGPGQKSNTRARKLLIRFKKSINRSAERYRAARAALQVLDPGGKWKGHFLPLSDTDLKGPSGHSLEEISDQAIMKKRHIKVGQRAGEGYRVLSWIWRVSRNRIMSEEEIATMKKMGMKIDEKDLDHCEWS